MRKYEVLDQVAHKPACTAIGNGLSNETLDTETRVIKLSSLRKINALVKLCGRACLSAVFLVWTTNSVCSHMVIQTFSRLRSLLAGETRRHGCGGSVITKFGIRIRKYEAFGQPIVMMLHYIALHRRIGNLRVSVELRLYWNWFN